MEKNNDLIDIVKLILSIMVLLIHTQIFEGTIIVPYLRLAVPLFFLFSSYLFFNKIQNIDKCNLLKALKKNIIRNLKLYIFWFVLLFPVTIYVREQYRISFIESILNIIHDFFLGSTFLASWYIIASVIGLCIVSVMVVYKLEKFLIVLCFSIYICCLFTTNYYSIIQDSVLSRYIYQFIEFLFPANSFLIAIFWISIGYFLSKKSNGSCHFKHKIYFLICLIVLGLEWWIIKQIGISGISDDCYVMLVPTSILAFKIIVDSKTTFSKAKICRSLSTFIYCSHFSVFLVVKEILKYFVFDNILVLSLFISIIIIIILFIIVKSLSKKIKILECAF